MPLCRLRPSVFVLPEKAKITSSQIISGATPHATTYLRGSAQPRSRTNSASSEGRKQRRAVGAPAPNPPSEELVGSSQPRAPPELRLVGTVTEDPYCVCAIGSVWEANSTEVSPPCRFLAQSFFLPPASEHNLPSPSRTLPKGRSGGFVSAAQGAHEPCKSTTAHALYPLNTRPLPLPSRPHPRLPKWSTCGAPSLPSSSYHPMSWTG
jgi:hypothetical protein